MNKRQRKKKWKKKIHVIPRRDFFGSMKITGKSLREWNEKRKEETRDC